MNGPFLLEVLRSFGHEGKRWVFLHSVPTLQEGLKVAERMSSQLACRLFRGAEWGRLYYGATNGNHFWQDEDGKQVYPAA